MWYFKFQKGARSLALILVLITISLLLILTAKVTKNTYFPFPQFALTTSEKSVSPVTRLMNSRGGFKDQRIKPIFRIISNCEITLVIILCDDWKNSQNVTSKHGKITGSVSNNFGRQIKQTLVLLKSALITSKFSGSSSCVRVIIVTEEKKHFEKIKKRIFIDEKWDSDFTQFLKLSFVKARYPPGTKWMRNLFRPCATLRLFLSDLLPSYETLIYVDTDIIFFRSLQELWAEFESFSNVTLGGMAPCLGHYGTTRNQVPFYGSTGLNAGLMLMNATRMRETQWTHKILRVTQMFKTKIILADQDILNIYFHQHPEELHLLSCDWNFRPFQCRFGKYCEDSRLLTQGISALHGNALTFTSKGPEPLFHTVFNVFQTTSLHSNFSLPTFIQRLDFLLLQKQRKFPWSHCVNYGIFNVVLLNGLNRLLHLQARRIDDNEH